MTCAHEVRRVSLDQSVLDDKEMLEDLIVAALNDASKKVAETSPETYERVTAGMNLRRYELAVLMTTPSSLEI